MSVKPAYASLKDYLRRMVELGASDLFLRTAGPPSFRVQGRIIRTDLPIPDADKMHAFVNEILTPVAMDRFLTDRKSVVKVKSVDFAGRRIIITKTDY